MREYKDNESVDLSDELTEFISYEHGCEKPLLVDNEGRSVVHEYKLNR